MKINGIFTPARINTNYSDYFKKQNTFVLNTASSDAVSFRSTHPKTELIPINKELFPWASKQSELRFDKIAPESLVLVHMTNFYPKDGKILSHQSATKDKNGISEARPTIHFALNKSVSEHKFGNAWSSMDYAIIMPFKKTVDMTPKEKILGGIQDDFFFLDEVEIPKGSIILKYNSSIPENFLQVSDTKDGVRLVQTSNRKLGEVADIIVRKTGYITYSDSMQKYLGASDEEMKTLTSIPDLNLKEFVNSVNQCGAHSYLEMLKEQEKGIAEMQELYTQEQQEQIKSHFEKQRKLCQIAEKYPDKLFVFEKAWSDFCTDNNYRNAPHLQSPWGKTEMSIKALDWLVKLNNDKWDTYKTTLSKILYDAKKEFPQTKKSGIDIDKIINIINESTKPSRALKKLADELKLKPLPDRGKIPPTTKEEKAQMLSASFALFLGEL